MASLKSMKKWKKKKEYTSYVTLQGSGGQFYELRTNFIGRRVFFLLVNRVLFGGAKQSKANKLEREPEPLGAVGKESGQAPLEGFGRSLQAVGA